MAEPGPRGPGRPLLVGEGSLEHLKSAPVLWVSSSSCVVLFCLGTAGRLPPTPPPLTLRVRRLGLATVSVPALRQLEGVGRRLPRRPAQDCGKAAMFLSSAALAMRPSWSGFGSRTWHGCEKDFGPELWHLKFVCSKSESHRFWMAMTLNYHFSPGFGCPLLF